MNGFHLGRAKHDEMVKLLMPGVACNFIHESYETNKLYYIDNDREREKKKK
jgi:hypothetical protein